MTASCCCSGSAICPGRSWTASGKKPPIADDYEVPCVATTATGWQRELLATLGLANPEAEPAE